MSQHNTVIEVRLRGPNIDDFFILLRLNKFDAVQRTEVIKKAHNLTIDVSYIKIRIDRISKYKQLIKMLNRPVITGVELYFIMNDGVMTYDLSNEFKNDLQKVSQYNHD